MPMNRKDAQTPDAEQTGVNAGVQGDLRSPSEGYVFPAGEPQHDDVAHYTGIGTDVFTPRLPKTGGK